MFRLLFTEIEKYDRITLASHAWNQKKSRIIMKEWKNTHSGMGTYNRSLLSLFWPQTHHNQEMNSIYCLITVKSVLFPSYYSSSCNVYVTHILTFFCGRHSCILGDLYRCMLPLFSCFKDSSCSFFCSSSSTTSYLIQKLCNHHRLLLWLYIIHFK